MHKLQKWCDKFLNEISSQDVKSLKIGEALPNVKFGSDGQMMISAMFPSVLGFDQT